MRRIPISQKKGFSSFIVVLLTIALGTHPASAQEKTAESKLKLADELCVQVVKRAAETKEICDCELLQEALDFARKATVLLGEAATEAENTGSIDLAQRAYDMAVNVVGPAVRFVMDACRYCAQTGMDLEAVGCFDESGTEAAQIAGLNRATIEKTLAAGAIPRPEPDVEEPVDDEPPIRDHEQPPESPV